MTLMLYPLLALALLQSASAAQLIDPTSKDNSPDCDCYRVSGPDPGFFQYHRFWDFRDISADGSNNFTSAPSLIRNDQKDGMEPTTSSFFNSSKWQDDWRISRGPQRPDSPVNSTNSAQNLFILRNTSDAAHGSTFLTFRTNRLADFVSTAELTSKQDNVLHSSIRARFRVIPNGITNSSDPSTNAGQANDPYFGSSAQKPVDSGAVVGFFTYLNDTQEADIEILTAEPTNFIHYTNQPDYDFKADKAVPDASSNVSIADSLRYTEWIDHRIDWYDGVSRWYVNNELVLNKTKNAPSAPSTLIANLWSDGGSWSGNMSVGAQVTVGIEWIEMFFNVSGDVKTAGARRDVPTQILEKRDGACKQQCIADSLQKVGFPEKYNGTSPTYSVGPTPTDQTSPPPATSTASSAAARKLQTGMGAAAKSIFAAILGGLLAV